MSNLPASPDLSHLKKQAKQLLRGARAGQAPALRRFIESLRAVRGLDLAALAAHELQLHDAQSVVAREYGFASWTELKRHVDWKRADMAERRKTWLRWAMEGNARERSLAVHTLRDEPALFAEDPWFACVTGDETALATVLAGDSAWANRPGGPLAIPPLAAVTHSLLILEKGFEAPLLASARLLLASGADPNGTWIDPRFPESPLSALYGAAGRTHHAGMTTLLLQAGAAPDDNESLYHSVESRDPSCTLLLLEAGARVIRTNAIGRVLDYDDIDRLRLLLRHGGDARERPWIHHAILRGRSLDHIRALIEAGADLHATNRDGISLYGWAQMQGRADVVALLHEAGVAEPLSETQSFVAACARSDEVEARALLDRTPDILSQLTPDELQTMPRMADVGELAAVRTMLSLGWPREVKTGWDATALNLAVFRGDATMAALLLGEGADWRTRHGFGDNVLGTLSYASRADDIDASAPRDFVGCARALVAKGVPPAEFRRYTFSPEITAWLQGRPLHEV